MLNPEQYSGQQLSLGLLKVHPELNVLPEAIQGQPFRYFTFTRTPEEGYGFKDLVLPQGWQKAVTNLREWFSDPALPDGVAELRLDPSTRLLTSITSESGANIMLTSSGEYVVSGISDLRAAVDIQDSFSIYMQPIFFELHKDSNVATYPVIYRAESGAGVHYGSKGLSLPGDRIWKSKATLISRRQSTKYTEDVRQMARNLGGKIGGISFFENGTLALVKMDGGLCSCYSLVAGSESKGYSPHNVQSAQDAVILHNAVSMYLNILLEKGV